MGANAIGMSIPPAATTESSPKNEFSKFFKTNV